MGVLLWILRILGALVLLRLLFRLLERSGVLTTPPWGRGGPPPPGGWPPGSPRAPESKAGGELVRDPECGTYVPKATALAVRFGGDTVHFCSAGCRDAYLEKARAHA